MYSVLAEKLSDWDYIWSQLSGKKKWIFEIHDTNPLSTRSFHQDDLSFFIVLVQLPGNSAISRDLFGMVSENVTL